MEMDHSDEVLDIKSLSQSYQMMDNVVRSTIYSTTNLQPYQSVYQSGSEIRIVIQKSPESAIEFDKQACLLSFRPVIKYNQDTPFASLAQSTLRSITITNANDCLLLNSVVIGSSQLLSQSGMVSGVTTRNQFMAYYNSLKKYKNKLSGEDDNLSGVNFPQECGRTQFMSNAVLPFTNTTFNPESQFVNSLVTGYGQNYSYNNVARAIVDQQYLYNMQSNPVKSTDTAGWLNCNWASANYVGSGTPIPTSCSGYVPRLPVNATSSWNGVPASQLTVTTTGASFNQMTRMITPSIQQYYKQQSRWQKMRARFQTIIQTIYNDSFNSSSVNCTMAPNQDQSGQNLYVGLVAQGLNNFGPCGVNQCYLSQYQVATSVQGVLGTGVANIQSQAFDLQQQSVVNPPSSQSSLWYAPEQFTQQIVDMADICMELKQIGTVILNEQIIIYLNWAQPNQCLSAFLTPTMICEGFPQPQTPTNPISGEFIAPSTAPTQPSVGQCEQGIGTLGIKNWLQSCLIGQTTISFTDVYLQLVYTRPDRGIFPLYKTLKEQPRRFQSLRCQVDQISNLNSTYTQRLQISGINYISAVVSFLLPQQQMPLQADYLAPQNTILDYQNSYYIPNVSAGDLRATIYDSVFCPYSTIQVQLDGKTYQSPVLPISNSTVACFQRTQQQIQQTFHGKVFGLSEDLDAFTQNRAVYCVQINSSLSPEMQAVDSQLLLQINFDASRLMAQTRAMALGADNLSNTFQLKTYIITNQCFVGAGSYVRTI